MYRLSYKSIKFWSNVSRLLRQLHFLRKDASNSGLLSQEHGKIRHNTKWGQFLSLKITLTLLTCLVKIILFVLPCRAAFTEKKITVIAGPNNICPITIFFNVVMMSRFGRTFDMKLNQKCKDGPKISIPYPAMRNVRTTS